MDKIFEKVSDAIEKMEDEEKNNIVIFPFGKTGRAVKEILNKKFGINELLCCDNLNCDYKTVYPLEYLTRVHERARVILACTTLNIYTELLVSLRKYVSEDNILHLFRKFPIGKYTYGPICEEYSTVESIGAFCSFALGSAVVANHALHISTHEFLSFPGNWKEHPAYMHGTEIKYKREISKTKIGNDVWIGKNATIISGCNIGNGAIIGAGAIITKDVPDYAIVGGTPAKIIRYRYSYEQIEKLNRIAWWDWPDSKIKAYIQDFYLDINGFIDKHYMD